MPSRRGPREIASRRLSARQPPRPPPLTPRSYPDRGQQIGQEPDDAGPSGVTGQGLTPFSRLMLFTTAGGVVVLILLVLILSLRGPPRRSDQWESTVDASPAESASVSASGGPPAGAAETSLVQLIKRIKPSVVKITTEGTVGVGIGTGFLVGTDGQVVTNSHVVKGARSATATFPNDRTVAVRRCLVLAPEKDLALLQLDRRAGLLPSPLKLCTALPEQGEAVYAYGGPLGLSNSVSDGIVSAIRAIPGRSERFADPVVTWIQHTAPISPGNSGGPLLNARGEVVGVNSCYLREAQNLNFAVSSRDVVAILP